MTEIEIVLYDPESDDLMVYQGGLDKLHLYWLLPPKFEEEQIYLSSMAPEDWDDFGLVKIGRV